MKKGNIKLHKFLKTNVDEIVEKIQSVATSRESEKQTVVNVGPFHNDRTPALKNAGIVYLAKGIQIILANYPRATMASLKHINLANQKIGWSGFSELALVLSKPKFNLVTFDFSNNNLFPNKATVGMVNNVSRFLSKDTLVGLTLSSNTLITFDENKLPSLSWLLSVLSNLKNLKILRLQNRLTKKFKLALGNILLDKYDANGVSADASGLYSSFLCNKFHILPKETDITILPFEADTSYEDGDDICNSDDIVLLAGILTNHEKINKLSINKHSINSVGANALSRLIANNKQIVELNLKFSILGDLGLKMLLDGLLLSKSSVVFLNIASTKVTEVGLAHFARELSNLGSGYCNLAY